MKRTIVTATVPFALAALALTGCSTSSTDAGHDMKAQSSTAVTEDGAAPEAVDENAAEAKAGDHLHTIGDGTQPQAGPYTLTVASIPEAGKEGNLTLSVESADGPVTDFAVAHTKKMHLLLTPEDLSTVVHVHPEPQQDGTWTVPVTFPSGGTWRVVADVAEETDTAGELQYYAMGTEIDVPGTPADTVPVPEPTDFVEVDGFSLDLQGDLSADEHGTLMVTITKDGKMVDLQDYMGAKAHLIAFNTDTYAYAHQHPAGGHDHGNGSGDDGHGEGEDDHGGMADMGSMLHFETEFPQAGTYVFFLQFQVDGKVHTASFTADVA